MRHSKLKESYFLKNEIRKLFIIFYIRCYFRHPLKENYVQRTLSCHNFIKSLNNFKVNKQLNATQTVFRKTNL